MGDVGFVVYIFAFIASFWGMYKKRTLVSSLVFALLVAIGGVAVGFLTGADSYYYIVQDINDSLNQCNSQLNDIISQCNAVLNNTINQYNDELNQYRDIINQYNRDFLRKTVSLREVREFLREDKTDERKYNLYDYNCEDFTNTLIRHALDRGIFMCEVDIIFNDKTAHAIAAVNTTEGVKYIEPQSDQIYDRIEIGKDFEGMGVVSKVKSCFDGK